MNLPVILAAVLALSAAFAAWRLWRTLIVLRPVAARLRGSDYREADRNYDRNLRRLCLSANVFERDTLMSDSHMRATECWYRFDAPDGTSHDVQFTRFIQRGDSPETAMMLWYDPANPDRFTRVGPGSWLLVLIASVAALAWLFASGGALPTP